MSFLVITTHTQWKTNVSLPYRISNSDHNSLKMIPIPRIIITEEYLDYLYYSVIYHDSGNSPNELKCLFMYKFIFPRRKLRLIIQGEQF